MSQICLRRNKNMKLPNGQDMIKLPPFQSIVRSIPFKYDHEKKQYNALLNEFEGRVYDVIK